MAVDQDAVLAVPSDEMKLDDRSSGIASRNRAGRLRDSRHWCTDSSGPAADRSRCAPATQKVGLVQLGAGELEVISDVLKNQGHVHEPLNLRNIGREDIDRLAAKRERASGAPARLPPARVKAMCSLHHGGSIRRTSSPSGRV